MADSEYISDRKPTLKDIIEHKHSVFEVLFKDNTTCVAIYNTARNRWIDDSGCELHDVVGWRLVSIDDLKNFAKS